MKDEALLGRNLGETVEWGHGFLVERASGSTLTGIDGRKYIDLSSGWNVVNVGWGRSEIRKAITKQLRSMAFRPLWCGSLIEIELSRKLATLTPGDLEVCFRATGGAEANEIALLLARSHTRRPRVISFEGAYHGATYGCLSTGDSPLVRRRLGPLLPGFTTLPMPTCFRKPCRDSEVCRTDCLYSLRAELSKRNVAAVITEVVATNPGVLYPGRSFFSHLRRECDRYGTLLIIDEIGTGFGRTGRMFAIDHYDVIPDIMTFAKALSGGYVPIGATITTRRIAKSAKGILDSPTFGWTPLACAASLANIRIIERESLAARAARMGSYVLRSLHGMLGQNVSVGEIRGIGMELAIEVVDPHGRPWREGAIEVVRGCEERGVVVEMSSLASAVLVMPPLTISLKEVNSGLRIIAESFKELGGHR